MKFKKATGEPSISRPRPTRPGRIRSDFAGRTGNLGRARQEARFTLKQPACPPNPKTPDSKRFFSGSRSKPRNRCDLLRGKIRNFLDFTLRTVNKNDEGYFRVKTKVSIRVVT